MTAAKPASEADLRDAADFAGVERVVEVPLEEPELALFVTPGGEAFCSACSEMAGDRQLYRVTPEGAHAWQRMAPEEKSLRCRCGLVELVPGRLEKALAS